jgi:hypothetical protein
MRGSHHIINCHPLTLPSPPMGEREKTRGAKRFGMVAALLSVLVIFSNNGLAAAGPAGDAFHQGWDAYVTGRFEQAAGFFREAAKSPTAGTLHNLGDAEWQCDHAGPAILAWEQAQWLNPFSRDTATNLRFARKARLLDAPELTWYEICSTWLPVDWWPWLACASFWVALGMVTLPGILRWRRAGWHQGLAAAGLAVFLLTLPALAGVHTRTKLGVLLPKETPLRLTPTSEAQTLTRLPGGETARLENERGQFVFIRTSNAAGWIERAQFGLICGGGGMGR